jgi:propanediol dehydratase small subunit
MGTAALIALFSALWLGGSIYLYLATRGRMDRYWQRSCTGRAWSNEFPTAGSAEIRRFLLLFVSAFALPKKRALQFLPSDRPLDIYRALNPLKDMPDALELETFAKRFESTYGFDLARIWREDITLGDVFAKTTAAV